jgi:type IV secretory pathway VirB2 component (pilin)
MANMQSPLGIVKEQSVRISQNARRWIIPLARFGYAAKGIVYLIIGVLAALAAFHKGGRTTDSRGALAEILSQPYGQLMLGAVAVGLIGYALWRLVQAVKNTENKGMATRVGYAVIAVLYTGLALSAVRMVMGSAAAAGNGEPAQEWTARLLAQPFGQLLVGAAGVGIIALGLYQFYKAYTVDFRDNLMIEKMSRNAESFAIRTGQFGLSARGIVFGMIGFFLILAALRSDASEAQGLSGALRALEQQTFAPWLFGLVALGLAAYGFFMLVLAKYRRIIIEN